MRLLAIVIFLASSLAAQYIPSPNGGTPGGAAGGALSGTYPNPNFSNPAVFPGNVSITGTVLPLWYDIRAYGAKCDAGVSGTTVTGTDDTAALTAAILAAYNAGGGGVHIPNAKCRIAGHVVLPNDGTGSYPGYVYAHQPYIRIWGEGDSRNGQGQAPILGGGSILLMTYAGAGVAKIETYGVGIIEIDHFTMWDPTGDTLPFLLTTGTTPMIHNMECAGTWAKSGNTSDQDCFLLGGQTTQPTSANDPTGAFQGFKPVIRDNYANHIRRFIVGGQWLAGGTFNDNMIGPQCGSNLANGAAFEFLANVPDSNEGNILSGNRCEITGYAYCFKFQNYTNNTIVGTDVEDAQNSYNLGLAYFDAASTGNYVNIPALPNTGGITYLTHVTDLTCTTLGACKNTVIDSTQSAPSNIGWGGTLTLQGMASDLPVDVFNGNPATNVANYEVANGLTIGGNYWTGSASARDKWTFSQTFAAGTNPASTLTLGHTGSSGALKLVLGAPTYWGTSNMQPGDGSININGTASIGASVFLNNNPLWIRTTTAATSGANQSGQSLYLSGRYWNGSVDSLDYWNFQNVLGSGTNPTTTLTIGHTGSSGAAAVAMPGGSTGKATCWKASGVIGYCSTVVDAAGACTCN